MIENHGSFFLTVQNTDGSYVWYQKQFSSLNEAVSYAVGEYLRPIWWDAPDLGIKEPRFRNNANASIDLETGTVSKIWISRSTYGVSGFRGNVRTITIENAAAVFHAAIDAARGQATN